jgi:microcystin-dependent protein
MAYIGEITLFACFFTPNGWFPCEGQFVPVQGYPGLFAVIGTNFGGNGSSNFKLPDLRAASPVGMGSGPGLSQRNIGATGGTPEVLLNTDEMPTHTHSPMASLKSTANSPVGAVWGTAGEVRPLPDLYAAAMVNPQAMTPGIIGSTGGGMPHNNLMPYQVITIGICKEGD